MRLPPELIGAIIQYVDARADLHKLLFVSHLVSYEAERPLYRAIHINPTASSLLALLFHLARCQRVAHQVRELGIYGSITLRPQGRIGVPTRSQIWHSLNQALCMLKNLRVLNLSMHIKSPQRGELFFRLPASLFSDCTFKLETLMLTNYIGRQLSHLDLTQVKELRLDRSPLNVEDVSPDAFLSLQILSSSLSQFIDLGANTTCRIKSLELFLDTNLLSGTKFISITSLKFYHWPSSGIQPFPSLRYLYAVIGRDGLSSIGLSSFLVGELSTLKDLEKLYLDGDSFPDFHVELFSAIPSLQELDIAHGVHDIKRWKRYDKEPVYIPQVLIEDEWKDTRWL